MKRIFIAVLVIFCTVSVFALEGKAVSVSGKVEMQKNGAEWVLLKEGDNVPPGAVISTGFKASAGIQLGGSILTVNQLTRITLRQLSESSNKVTTDIYLDAGSLCADVKPMNNKANGFQVQTSVVTSSVRGTTMVMDAMSNVYMPEHDVLITTSSGQKIIVSEGETVTVSEGIPMAVFGIGNQMINYPKTEKMSLSGGDSSSLGEKMFSIFSKGNVSSGVEIAQAIIPVSNKNLSPLEIVAGEFGNGTIHLVPATGFSDSSEIATYEELLYSTAITLSFE